MIFPILLYLLITVIILGPSIGLGFLLCWIFPEINLGIGILTGVVLTGFTIHLFIKLNMAINESDNDLMTVDESEDQVIVRVNPFLSARSKRKKKRR